MVFPKNGDYGQNGQKWRFVRKIRVKSWRIARNKKKSVPSLKCNKKVRQN